MPLIQNKGRINTELNEKLGQKYKTKNIINR